jgi:hypothetical protein
MTFESSLRRSSTPSPVGPNQKKAGKSLSRSRTMYFKQAKNEKPSPLSHVDTTDYFGFKKDSARTKDSILHSPADYHEPLKNKNFRTLRKTASTPILQLPKISKKVEPLGSIKEPRQKAATSPLLGNSKIPVPTSTDKKSVSTPSTKKDTTTRTSHRNCLSCSRNHHHNTVNNTHHNNTVVNKVNTVKRKNSRILRFNKIKDNQLQNDDTSSPNSTSTSIKKSLIPKLSQNLFKKRVSPLRSSTPTLNKIDELSPVETDQVYENTSLQESVNEETENLLSFKELSSSPKPIYESDDYLSSSQKSINKPETSSISITNNVQVSTTTFIINPEISLIYNAEKNFSNQDTKYQTDENDVVGK